MQIALARLLSALQTLSRLPQGACEPCDLELEQEELEQEQEHQLALKLKLKLKLKPVLCALRAQDAVCTLMSQLYKELGTSMLAEIDVGVDVRGHTRVSRSEEHAFLSAIVVRAIVEPSGAPARLFVRLDQRGTRVFVNVDVDMNTIMEEDRAVRITQLAICNVALPDCFRTTTCVVQGLPHTPLLNQLLETHSDPPLSNMNADAFAIAFGSLLYVHCKKNRAPTFIEQQLIIYEFAFKKPRRRAHVVDMPVWPFLVARCFAYVSERARTLIVQLYPDHAPQQALVIALSITQTKSPPGLLAIDSRPLWMETLSCAPHCSAILCANGADADADASNALSEPLFVFVVGERSRIACILQARVLRDFQFVGEQSIGCSVYSLAASTRGGTLFTCSQMNRIYAF